MCEVRILRGLPSVCGELKRQSETQRAESVKLVNVWSAAISPTASRCEMWRATVTAPEYRLSIESTTLAGATAR
jgi:hypothetical protein